MCANACVCLSVCMSLVLVFGFFFCLLLLSYSDLYAFIFCCYSLDICLLTRGRRAVDLDGGEEDRGGVGE